MQKFLTDMHTHTSFSHDGRDKIETMLETARQKGLTFYGIWFILELILKTDWG